MNVEVEPGDIYWVTPQPAIRAVQLTDEADWEAIADWCGGELVNMEQGKSGGYETELRIVPGGIRMPWVGVLNDWVIRGITGEFFIRSPEEFDASYSRDGLSRKAHADGE